MLQSHSPSLNSLSPTASTTLNEVDLSPTDNTLSTTINSSFNTFNSSSSSASSTATAYPPSPLSESQRHSDALAQRISVAIDQAALTSQRTRPNLPFGARAAPVQPTPETNIGAASIPTTNSTSSTSATSSTNSSRLPDPSILVRAAHIGRTPPPPYPEYQKYGKGKAVGAKGKIFWAGLKVFGAMEFVGEVFADFFGLYDSRYQYVVDAYERNKRELEFERSERAAARREQREEQRQLEEAAEPQQIRTEQNRREEMERRQAKEATASQTKTTPESSQESSVVDSV